MPFVVEDMMDSAFSSRAGAAESGVAGRDVSGFFFLKADSAEPFPFLPFFLEGAAVAAGASSFSASGTSSGSGAATASGSASTTGVGGRRSGAVPSGSASCSAGTVVVATSVEEASGVVGGGGGLASAICSAGCVVVCTSVLEASGVAGGVPGSSEAGGGSSFGAGRRASASCSAGCVVETTSAEEASGVDGAGATVMGSARTVAAMWTCVTAASVTVGGSPTGGSTDSPTGGNCEAPAAAAAAGAGAGRSLEATVDAIHGVGAAADRLGTSEGCSRPGAAPPGLGVGVGPSSVSATTLICCWRSLTRRRMRDTLKSATPPGSGCSGTCEPRAAARRRALGDCTREAAPLRLATDPRPDWGRDDARPEGGRDATFEARLTMEPSLGDATAAGAAPSPFLGAWARAARREMLATDLSVGAGLCRRFGAGERCMRAPMIVIRATGLMEERRLFASDAAALALGDGEFSLTPVLMAKAAGRIVKEPDSGLDGGGSLAEAEDTREATDALLMTGPRGVPLTVGPLRGPREGVGDGPREATDAIDWRDLSGILGVVTDFLDARDAIAATAPTEGVADGVAGLGLDLPEAAREATPARAATDPTVDLGGGGGRGRGERMRVATETSVETEAGVGGGFFAIAGDGSLRASDARALKDGPKRRGAFRF